MGILRLRLPALHPAQQQVMDDPHRFKVVGLAPQDGVGDGDGSAGPARQLRRRQSGAETSS